MKKIAGGALETGAALAIGRQLALIVTAATGGAIFACFGIAAAWMSGGMIAVAILAAARLAAPPSRILRQAAMLLSGAVTGSAVTPAMLGHLGAYPASLALMMLAIVLMTICSVGWLRRSPGWTRPTALFAAVPGALSYVFALAATTQANLPRVAVVQLCRTFILMAVLPFAISQTGVMKNLPFAGPTDGLGALIILAAGSIAIGFGLERLRVAGGMLFGAMLVSALLHGMGVAPGRVPYWLQAAGQMLIGAWMGARFVGFDWRLLARSVQAAIGSFALAMLIATIFAYAAATALNIPFAETLIAFAPGGLEAMTVLAFALGLDPLYVGAHHLVRFVAIGLILPIVARYWLRNDDAQLL